MTTRTSSHNRPSRRTRNGPLTSDAQDGRVSSQVKVLHDLPPEIIFLVFEYLPDEDLYRVAFCCRYFHHLALPVYLSRYGSGPNSGEFIFDNVMCEDVLKALHSALYRPRLNRLAVTFDFGSMLPSPWEAEPDQDHDDGSIVARISRLLDVADVDDVHLQLGDLSRQKARAEDRLSAGTGARSLEDDRLTLAIQHSGDRWVHIMNDFLFKAKCRSLTVDFVSFRYSTSNEFVEEAIIRNYYGYNTLYRVGRQHWLLKAAVAGASKLFGSKRPKLEKFQVHSEILFHPALINWTIGTLNLSSSSLTSLSFGQLNQISSHTWSLLLPCFSTPNLLDLSIGLCAIQTEDLYQFLARHPTIRHLHLGSYLPPPDSNSKAQASLSALSSRRYVMTSKHSDVGGKTFLPALRTLTGPPDYLVELLSSPHRPFPTLQTVCVWYRTKRATQFTLNALNHDLAPICLRLRSVPEVVLSISFEASGIDWVVGPPSGCSSAPNGSAPIAGSSNGAASVPAASPSSQQQWGSAFPSFSSAPATPTPQAQIDNGDPPPPPSVSFVSSCVTKLEFKANVYVLPPPVIFSLPKWLGAFTKVRELSVKTLASVGVPVSLGGRASRGEGNGPFEQQLSLNHKSIFLNAVSKHCPLIRKIEVDGKQEDVPNFRAIVRLK
ncbi:hypothetical protein EST38_g4047 [Candolleomyces aberdarensis]|uniref:F-box domain-containing protein n=1 Tax=Candolleomyces aberdarensis TaxID=2316362 RepID=A0A4Q2DQU7_9AGAR|nr:hypothetical protein EST38_g4047 [Candolleomyces aberdarensis]